MRSPTANTARSLAQLLASSDRRSLDDLDRGAEQRAVARAVHVDASLIDAPALRARRRQLRAWSRWVPFLLDDEAEAEITRTGRPYLSAVLDRLAVLDEPGAPTDVGAAEALLRHLDIADTDRVAADRAAAAILTARGPAMASVIHDLTVHHANDDARRGIVDWRLRSAVLDGTTADVVRECLAAAHAAQPVAHRWFAARAAVVGTSFSDRRLGKPIVDGGLREHASAAAAALGRQVPALADAATRAAAFAVEGPRDEVSVDGDGRITLMVDQRPTARARLMTAHELGHAVQVLIGREAGVSEPPGALVAETIGCWSALACGRRWVGTGDVTWALALGDHLINELFMSAAISAFEDRVQSTVRAGARWTQTVADDTWYELLVELYGERADVPRWAASGWTRFLTLAREPGAPARYVWATLLALAIVDDRRVPTVLASGLDADELPGELGLDADTWITSGVASLEATIDGLISVLRQEWMGSE